MNYRIVVKIDDVVYEIFETHDTRLAFKFISRWFRKSADYVGVTMTFESRKIN